MKIVAINNYTLPKLSHFHRGITKILSHPAREPPKTWGLYCFFEGIINNLPHLVRLFPQNQSPVFVQKNDK